MGVATYRAVIVGDIKASYNKLKMDQISEQQRTQVMLSENDIYVGR